MPGPPGQQGKPGLHGNPGPQGIQGLHGNNGLNGLPGKTGPTGSQGIEGPRGEAGGPTGPSGIEGPTGSQGPPGIRGNEGPTGLPGNTGPPGIRGNEGPTGLPGNTGPPGIRGNEGPTGPPGIKSFVIDHPNDENKYLVHACLEGPEAGVYYRGTGEIINNKNTKIYLPDYVESFAKDFTIQLTPIYNYNTRNLNYSATEISNNSFEVYGENGKFYWFVFGKRCDINVEVNKNMVNVKGNGPYLWL
jgi:hypothetical protein